MANYEIQVFETWTLDQEKGTTPLYRTKDYIEGAFSYVNDHTVTVDVRTYNPLMYQDDETDENWGYSYEQTVLDGGSKTEPCASLEKKYRGIGYYFNDWLECEYDPHAYDIHILLTSAHSQGGHTIHYSDYSVCVVEGGYMVPDAPSTFTRYEPEDDTTTQGVGLDAVQTTHHELGHAFIHDDEDAHDDHNLGNMTKTSSSNYWVSPLGLGDDDTSACQSYDLSSYSVPGDRRWDLVWGDCCIAEWEHPLG